MPIEILGIKSLKLNCFSCINVPFLVDRAADCGWWEMKSLKLLQVPRDSLIPRCFLSHLLPVTEGEPFQKHISSASYVLYLKSAWEECQAVHQTGSRMLLFLFSPHDYVLTDIIISEIKCWKILWTWYTRGLGKPECPPQKLPTW